MDDVRCVAGCALGLAVSVSPAFLSSFGVLARPMAESFGWSRSAVFAAVTIFSATCVLLTPFVGRLLDQVGSRTMALCGLVAVSIGVGLQALVPACYPLFLAAAVITALLGAGSGPAVYLSVIIKQFDRHVGIALGLAMAGLGLGQSLAVLVTQALLTQLGWRGAWGAISAIIAVLGLCAFAIIPWPRLQSVGRDASTARHAVSAGAVWPLLIKTPLFWTLSLTLMIVLMTTAGIQLNMVAAMHDKGIGTYGSASAAALIPLAAVFGRLLTGALVDRLSYVVIGATLFLGACGGCLLIATAHSLAQIYAASLLIGLGYGAESDLLPYVIRRRFGTEWFGSIYGLMFGIVQVGVMLGPFLAANAYDRYGDYRLVFTLFSGTMLLAVTLWFLSSRLPSHALGRV